MRAEEDEVGRRRRRPRYGVGTNGAMQAIIADGPRIRYVEGVAAGLMDTISVILLLEDRGRAGEN